MRKTTHESTAFESYEAARASTRNDLAMWRAMQRPLLGTVMRSRKRVKLGCVGWPPLGSRMGQAVIEVSVEVDQALMVNDGDIHCQRASRGECGGGPEGCKHQCGHPSHILGLS